MVKFFTSFMADAPVLSGVAGAWVAVKDACLLNGFNLKSLDSLTITGGVATASRGAGMIYEPDSVVLIAGITGGAAALNGDRRVLSATATTFTFDATGIADQAAAGTITAKYSPAGWAKTFSGTNLAVYRSSDTTSGSLRMHLRVDDTGTTNARLVGYETMSDVNTGTGAFPTNAAVAGGTYASKSSAASAVARNWAIVVDDRTVYWWTCPNSTTAVTSQGDVRGFGDLLPRNSADAYAAFLNCDTANSTALAGPSLDLANASMASATIGNTLTLARSWTGIGSFVTAGIYAESRKGNGTNVKSGSGVLPFPNGPDNGLELERACLLESDLTTRGTLPGLYHMPQNVGFVLSTLDRVAGSGALAGRKLLVLRVGQLSLTAQNATGNHGAVAFDITGPWR